MFSPFPDTPGIYRIFCTANKKFYIGSAKNLRERRNTHFHELRHDKHVNPKLQAAWNKYGESTFVFEIIETVLILELLTTREQYWFNKLKPFGKRGFNLSPVAGSALGRRHSLATRAKMGDARRGKPNPHPGYSHTNRGQSVPPERRAKLRAANKGKKPSTQSIENARIANAGNAYRAKDYIVTSPEGIEYVVHNMAKFCRENQLNKVNLGKVALGQRNHCKGWIARFPEADTEAS